MDSLTSGTMAGSGSFRCRRCGYVLTLAASDRLSDCPGCGGRSFVRASLFSTGRFPREETVSRPDALEREEWLEEMRERIEQPGEYIVYEEGGEPRIVALTREWTRVGRSLAADVRFDDPTVSRRHALIVRQADGVRVLDDRSLNGVFVNDERIEWRVLQDGDEIVVGRYRLGFLSVPAVASEGPFTPGRLRPIAKKRSTQLRSVS
jgi:predicted  nucleic acid-binding Zn-ribbon protein